MDAAGLSALRKQVTVELAPERAFELFTAGLQRWWPLATHSCFQGDAVRVVIEPRVGGQVVEHASDGRQAEWGRVLAWDPPAGFAMTWHPGNDPSAATHVAVRFEEAGAGRTLLTLVHSGWEARGERAPAVRGEYDDGWGRVLERYRGAASPAA